MNSEAKILIAVGAVVAVVASVFVLSQPKAEQPSAAGDKLVRDDSHQTNPGAKVTLVEFADFQCPACQAVQPTVDQIKTEQGAKINFVFRHFPLTSHRNARPAANAAEAAGAQGKFFEMVTLLYQKQTEWSEAADPKSLFAGYARELGLDGAKIEQAITTRQYDEILNRDYSDGEASGVNGTPTFFLDGKQVEATQLKTAVAEAVKNSGQ